MAKKKDTSLHGKKNFDQEYYRRFFNLYNKQEFQIYENWFRGWERFIFSRINLPTEGKKVIEIGCSIGAFTKILKERGFEVTATDISSFILKKAKNLQKDVRFEVFDVEKDKKLGKKYDYVFAFEVVEHLNDPGKAIANIYSLLRDGGMFVFSTPFPSKQSLADPTHINVHEVSGWLQFGKKAGFIDKKHVYATFIPYLYRFSGLLSIGFPIKLDLPLLNSTSFFFFKK